MPTCRPRITDVTFQTKAEELSGAELERQATAHDNSLADEGSENHVVPPESTEVYLIACVMRRTELHGGKRGGSLLMSHLRKRKIGN